MGVFVATMVHHQYDYWILNHKVNFDPIKRLIIVHDDVTTLDVKINLYSDMKEWMGMLERDNRKYKPPIRVIGGDNTVSGQKAGDIYFMQHGWRVVYDPTKVTVTGVLFSDDYDTAWLYSKDMTPIYPALVSSLVTSVQPTLTGLNIPTSAQNASAVRSELTTELSRIDVATSTRSSQTSVDTVQATVTSIEGKVDAVIVTLANISTVIDTMLKYQANKTVIDPNAFTMTIYEVDGTTPFKVFDLQNASGVASITDIYRRIPR